VHFLNGGEIGDERRDDIGVVLVIAVVRMHHNERGGRQQAKGDKRRQVSKQPFHVRVLLVNGWPRGTRTKKQQRK
jgi:hypothetical protein